MLLTESQEMHEAIQLLFGALISFQLIPQRLSGKHAVDVIGDVLVKAPVQSPSGIASIHHPATQQQSKGRRK